MDSGLINGVALGIIIGGVLFYHFGRWVERQAFIKTFSVRTLRIKGRQ